MDNRKGMKPWEQLPWVGRPVGWTLIQIVLAIGCVALGVELCLRLTNAAPPPGVVSE